LTKQADSQQELRGVSSALRGLFAVSSLGLLAALGAWIADEIRPEWTRYYLAATAPGGEGEAASEAGEVPLLVPQILVPELQAVDRCIACHAQATVRASAQLGRHPGPMLEVHEAAGIGCTVCHDGQGRATTTDAAHGEVEHWNAPLLRGTLVQASCSRCHARSTVPRAPALRRGADFMERRACFGCHVMPGEGTRGAVGPDLSYAVSRNDQAWLVSWLKSPGKVLASPRMADFTLSDQDVADIVAYLSTSAGKHPIPDPGFDSDSAGDDELDALYDKGASIYRVSRCVSCHAVNGTGGTVGPDHGRIGHKLSFAALAAWLARPETFHPGTRMPLFRLSDKDRLAVAFYLSEEMRDPDLEPRLEAGKAAVDALGDSADPERGRKRIHALGCLGCHRLDGQQQAQPVGADLTLFGEKPVERLPFVEGWNGPRTREAWTRAKLKEPRAGSDTLLMPRFDLTAEEVEALLVAVLSLTRPAPESRRADLSLVQPAPPYPPGRAGELMRELKCLACHAFDGQGAPHAPDLGAVGSRVKLDWLSDFLREPYEVRPTLVMRMPRFYLAKDEIDTLAGYLHLARVRDGLPRAGLADAGRGEKLYGEYRCAGCHIIGEAGGAVGPNLSGSGNRLEPAWMAWQLLHPDQAFAKEPQFVRNEQDALDLAAFLAGLRMAKPVDADGGTR
jgi:mono/diheme cytochrome c family protein